MTAALTTTCGSDRVRFGAPSPLADATARERALELAQARGALQEAFAGRLLAGLLTARRRGRYVHYTLNVPETAALGTDTLAAVLR